MSQAWGYAMALRSPTSRYHQIDLATRTDGASPHALVAMLYSELGVALEIMAREATLPDAPRRSRQKERVTAMLHMLDASLDRKTGGDLAKSLSTIYRQMLRRLAAAHESSVDAIIEVRDGVASLADAWDRIAA